MKRRIVAPLVFGGHRTDVRPLLLLLASVPSALTPLSAQDPITDDRSCTDCEVVLASFVSLGDRDGPGALPGFPRSVQMDGHGRYWVIYAEGLPMVFDQRGRFIQEVGRIGDGPGEFRRPSAAAVIGDSLAILDEAGRIVVVGPDLSPARTVRMHQVRASDVLALDWPRSVLVNGVSRTPDLAGWPLHLADLSGPDTALRKSFGTDGGVLLPGTPRSAFIRFIAPRVDGGAWALRYNRRYEVVRWSAQGELQERYLRESELFPRGFDGLGGGPQVPPSPALVDIRQAPDSLIWVVGRVPVANWAQAWRDIGVERLPEAPTRVSVSSFPAIHDLYESVVEIIDPARAQVVWRESPEAYVVGFLRGPRMVTYNETEMGVPFLEVSEVQLRRNGPLEKVYR